MSTEPAKEIVQEAAKSLGVGQLLPELYHDLLQPAVRETGQNLVPVAKAVGIAIVPLKAAVWGFDKVRDYLSVKVAARLATKAAGEIKTPNPIIAGPVIMGMAFTSEAPHLREMYANLLAAAMHGPSEGLAHPSFATLIQQLCPDEALILRQLGKEHKAGEPVFHQIIDPNYAHGTDQNQSIETQWFAYCLKLNLTATGLGETYKDNLLRLAILAERTELLGHANMLGLWETRYLSLTEYGDLFLDVCVRG
jgi:hypothetical protein